MREMLRAHMLGPYARHVGALDHEKRMPASSTTRQSKRHSRALRAPYTIFLHEDRWGCEAVEPERLSGEAVLHFHSEDWRLSLLCVTALLLPQPRNKPTD